MTPSDEAKQLATKLWDYHHMHHTLKPADFIMVLGSRDKKVAFRGAELFKQGLAPQVIVTGGAGGFTKDLFTEPESKVFANILETEGVPASVIIQEDRAKSTGDNFLLTKVVLAQKNLPIHSAIVVTKPYMERRTFATAMKLWPEVEWLVTSPQVDFETDLATDISPEAFINTLVGDLQRIKLYPKQGFQIKQNIPDDIWKAYERLVALGYTKRLIV